MKRLNVKLLAILFATAMTMCLGGVGLYRFQMGRSTQTFLAQAQEYKQQGDLENARKSLNRYLQYRPDDSEKLVQLALWTKQWFDDLVVSGSSIEPRDFQQTYGLIEAGLRQPPDPNNVESRLELLDAAIEFAMMTGRMPDAISHLQSRIEMGGKDQSKYVLQLATCHARIGEDEKCIDLLCKLIGLDLGKSLTGEPLFDVASAKQPDEVNAYLLMSDILISRRRQPELADKVIDQMVDVNPDSAMAYVGRARYLRIQKELTRIGDATRDVNKAMSLSTGDEKELNAILKEAADVYVAAREFPQAYQQLDRFRERNPDSPESYRMLSTWALKQNDASQARNFINEGLERNPTDQGLLESLVILELEKGSSQGAEAGLETLRQTSINPAIVDYYEARLELIRGRTVQAARKLEEISQAVLLVRPGLKSTIDRALAAAYTQLGQSDRALQRQRMLVESNPNDMQSLWGMILSHRDLGQVGEAINAYVQLTAKVAPNGKLPTGYPFLVQHLEMELLRQKQRPESQRSWELAESIVGDIQAAKGIPNDQKFTILANYFDQIGDVERAERMRKYLSDQDPNNVALRMSEIAKLAESDVDAAIAMLDEFEKATGEKTVATQLMRLELLGKQQPEDFREQLVTIESHVQDFPPSQRVLLYKALGAGYMALQETNEVERLYLLAIENAPQDVDMRMQMLQLALHRGDETSMKSAIANIEEVFGAESPAHNWALASELIWRYKNGLEDDGALDKANNLVQAGLTKREGWAQLRHLSAEINKLKGDSVAAINDMEKALKSGRARPKDILELAQLLYRANRLDDAKQQYESLDRRLWNTNDELAYMEILSRLGQLPADVEFDENSKNAFYHLNIGKILANDAQLRAKLQNQPQEVTDIIPKRLAVAAQCFRKSVDLEPTLEEGWKYLIRTLVMLGKKDEAAEAIRQAQLEITEERSQLFLAQVNEYMGKPGEAYAHYKGCLKTDPNDVEALAGIVNLLRFGNGQPGSEERRKEADVYVDRMIDLAPDPSNPARTQLQASARRMRAQDLATSNTYHDFVKALSLLEQNQAPDQPMATEDLLLFATLSASRNDGVSRGRAIQKLEEIRDEGKRRLTNQELLILAELYKKQDRWQDCSSVMNNLLAKYPNDMQLLGPWLAWLVEADQLKLAERWLENANPSSLAYVRTRAHIWVKNGDTARALELLQKVIPKEIKTPEQESLTVSLANMMEQMAEDDPQLYPYVESILLNYTRQAPEQSLLLAGYYGRRGGKEQIDNAFKICQAHVNAGRLQETLPVALGILRVNQARIPIGSPYHRRVETWFDSAEKAAPNSPALAIQRSEFDGLTGDFEAVERNLRRYIASESITPQQKATAYNNLAYVLALQGKGEESMSLVNEAVDILGPISDLRDTRAMVYLALDKPNQALEDLEAAIAHGGESAFKLFHKALAELKTGNRENAAESMQKAIELGLEVNQLNVLEKRQFETLISQLNIDLEATKPVSAVAP